MAVSANGVAQVQQRGSLDDRDIDAVGRNRLALSQIGIAWTESAAMRTVVQLDVPRILAKHSMPLHHAMSAQQLVEHMPGASNPNAGALQHLMQLLACKGLFTEHLECNNPPGVSGGTVVRTYALNSVSRRLVGDDPRDSMANFAYQMTLGTHVAATLQYLGEAILTSKDPFQLAHGVNYFEYMATHPEVLNVFQNAMAERSRAETGPLLLSRYKGFDTVKGLMDVGGGTGVIVAQIVRHYPHITHAVNFDLPEVVALAPAHRGVEHVGGDMLKSIPTGCDAIFMKKLLHDWDDESCIKILKNCYEALPERGGKVILVEGVLSPQETPGHTSAKSNDTVEDELFVLRSSVIMFVHCIGGKERSQQDFERLVTAAGFHNFQLLCKLDASYVMEAHK